MAGSPRSLNGQDLQDLLQELSAFDYLPGRAAEAFEEKRGYIERTLNLKALDEAGVRWWRARVAKAVADYAWARQERSDVPNRGALGKQLGGIGADAEALVDQLVNARTETREALHLVGGLSRVDVELLKALLNQLSGAAGRCDRRLALSGQGHASHYAFSLSPQRVLVQEAITIWYFCRGAPPASGNREFQDFLAELHCIASTAEPPEFEAAIRAERKAHETEGQVISAVDQFRSKVTASDRGIRFVGASLRHEE